MKTQLHKRTRTKICVATSYTTGKIRVHIKPGLDVFVNDISEVKKVKAKYGSHATPAKPSNDLNYGFQTTR